MADGNDAATTSVAAELLLWAGVAVLAAVVFVAMLYAGYPS